MGVVYPELTIGGSALASMSQNLSDGTWDECDLSIIVAGSRHHMDGNGSRFNISTVLDGYGTVLAEHRKLYRFSEGSGPHEAIELGTRVQVLVCEQAILAFGICLDFCNLAEDPPYLELDVDYVVVPSCGGESTMKSHIARSSDLFTRLKSQSVVVQQFHAETPKPTDPLGYVLARTSSQVPDLSSLERRDPWTVCNL
jgi:predicted amidohydrolase